MQMKQKGGVTSQCGLAFVLGNGNIGRLQPGLHDAGPG